MNSWSALADLPLSIDSYRLEGLSQDVTSGFTRHTTLITLSGAGHDGVGEDVTYDEDDQLDFQRRGAVHELAGQFTLASFSERLEGLALFAGTPQHAPSVDYRRWGFESAALDLALRQNGTNLCQILDRPAAPLNFVISIRLDDESPSVEPLTTRLEKYPWMRFKLDPTSAWTDSLLSELAALDVVDVVDFKGHYEGTVVDQAADADLYRRVVEALPSALIEDPLVTPETRPVLDPCMDRVTWDAPIHSVADVEQLEVEPKVINLKPSRFGTLERILTAYDHCAGKGIRMYGGGQFELGRGREHIQYLASLFHADGSNDVAPPAFNEVTLRADLPASPLSLQPAERGFLFA